MATLETTQIAEFLNQRVFLISNSDTNKQLGVKPDGTVYTHLPNELAWDELAWDIWTVQDAGNGTVFLVSALDTQLGSRPDGSVYTNSNRREWEQWRIEPVDEGRFFLFTSVTHGLHLGARPDGSVYTHTNRASWEIAKQALSSENPKLLDVNSLLSKIKKDGVPIKIPYPLFSVKGHIQGIASKGDLIYISQNVTPSVDIFSISKASYLKSIKLDTALPHYSAIQRIGDYLAVAVETEGDAAPRSEIRFIDLTTNKVVPRLTLHRETSKAGAVGIANYTKEGTERLMLVVHDNGNLDFYDAATLLLDPSIKFQWIGSCKLERGYDSVALIVNQQQEIFLAGFWTDNFGVFGTNDDYIDLLKVTPDLQSINCTMVHEKLHFITNGLPGLLRPHFRYAGGIEIDSESHVRILASSRGEVHINVNLFKFNEEE
ncbi:hypothetical protein NIES4103_22660 [Nostoc sp. NIES-4103]|nr:hypothetical protein NIES4103_22660 [Nostoc sp. NIES-4103]